MPSTIPVEDHAAAPPSAGAAVPLTADLAYLRTAIVNVFFVGAPRRGRPRLGAGRRRDARLGAARSPRRPRERFGPRLAARRPSC